MTFQFPSTPDTNPFLTVIGFVQAQSRVAICAALNHLLALEPELQAMLSHHSDRTVQLRWPPKAFLPAGELALKINAQCLFEPYEVTAPADVTITVLEGLLAAPEAERLRFLRVEGDAMLAQTLALLAQRLRWDAEHDLARFVGDAPAGWLARHAKAFATDLAQAAKALQAKSAAFLGGEMGVVANAEQFHAHGLDLAAFKTQLDALEARIKHHLTINHPLKARA